MMTRRLRNIRNGKCSIFSRIYRVSKYPDLPWAGISPPRDCFTCGTMYTYNLDGRRMSMMVLRNLSRPSDSLRWAARTHLCRLGSTRPSRHVPLRVFLSCYTPTILKYFILGLFLPLVIDSLIILPRKPRARARWADLSDSVDEIRQKIEADIRSIS
jgi:hypothetical protein